MTTRRTWSGTIALEDRARAPYLDLPVDVPAGIGSVEIRLTVESGGDARIELGCRGPACWRGWSGSARRRAVIGAVEATWRYSAGEPELGVWHVALGLHQVPLCGAEVGPEVSWPAAAAAADPDRPSPAPATSRRPERPLPAPRGLRWYAGDFHTHTLHSDGASSVDQLARLAVDAGLDFIAVTDHNTISHHAQSPVPHAGTASRWLQGRR